MVEELKSHTDNPPKSSGPNKKRLRVAFYAESWNYGGVESFSMNMLRNFPIEQMDVSLINTWSTHPMYMDEVEKMGVDQSIVFEGTKPNIARRTMAGLRAFDALLAEKNYDVAHINTLNGMGHAYAWIAKRRGVPVRIVHSHNSWFGGGAVLIRNAFHHLGRNLFGGAANVRLACSPEAGKHVFGKRPFKVLHNGIDVDKFKFSEDSRNRIRSELEIDSKVFVVGSVGRLSPQKDPLFQIKVFNELRKFDCNSVFLMVGSGELEPEVNSLVSELGLADSVVFIPATDAPEDYLCALDVFLFPSEYEGLPIAAIEAQCSGLPVLAADNLPRSLAITDLVHWKDKSDGPIVWAEQLVSLKPTRDRAIYAQKVSDAGYSASAVATRLFNLYQQRNES